MHACSSVSPLSPLAPVAPVAPVSPLSPLAPVWLHLSYRLQLLRSPVLLSSLVLPAPVAPVCAPVAPLYAVHFLQVPVHPVTVLLRRWLSCASSALITFGPTARWLQFAPIYCGPISPFGPAAPVETSYAPVAPCRTCSTWVQLVRITFDNHDGYLGSNVIVSLKSPRFPVFKCLRILGLQT